MNANGVGGCPTSHTYTTQELLLYVVTNMKYNENFLRESEFTNARINALIKINIIESWVRVFIF